MNTQDDKKVEEVLDVGGGNDSKKEQPATQVDTESVRNKVGSVLDNSTKTKKYLEESLPETEERIKTQMDPNCEVAVVIPSYGEWDYIFRPLESLAKQEGVTTDQYEVIVVVNNPPDPPSLREGESQTFFEQRLSLYNKAVRENQKTIELIRYINGENIELDLTPTERKKADRIKSSGVKIYCIDKASAGKTLSKDSANVGGARDRGVAEAIERFQIIKKNGIIAQTDADTSCDPSYIHGLIQVFKESPNIVGLVGGIQLGESDLDDKMLRIGSLYTKLNSRYDFLLNILLKRKQETPVEKVELCGANMASRAFETAIAGGVPKLSSQEDTRFGENLAKIGRIVRDGRVKTMPMNRLSARTSAHGHGYRKLSVADSVAEKGTVFVQDPEQLAKEIPLVEAAAKLIEIFCKNEGVKNKYERYRAELIEDEKQWLSNRMSVVEMLLENANLDADSVVQIINSRKGTFGFKIEDDAFLEDLSKGTAVTDKFVEIANTSETKQEAIRRLKETFIEDLIPLEENPILLKSYELKALYKAMQ
jgi:GT2 family glycosyltransferase